MTNDLSAQAGNILSATKEEDRMPDDLAARKRKAKLMKPGTVEEQNADTSSENATANDDAYFDVLLKFGIQI